MSLIRSLNLAFSRTVDQAKHSLASALRFETSPPTTAEGAHVPIYTLSSLEGVKSMAIGCDADVGGLSSAKVDLDPQEGKGRFWGTLSSEIPRNAKIERSGYAGFRNKNRSTLFGVQTWDATMHPFLCLRVKNRLAKAAASSLNHTSSPSLRSALSSASTTSTLSANQKAVNALGLDLPENPGPKFFVNVQTDGPVTSDLFQHRLLLDESKGNAWQDVIIPLSDFVLLNTGQVSPSQITMMREKIRTVGISVMLEHPAATSYATDPEANKSVSNAPPEALRKDYLADNANADGQIVEEKSVPTTVSAGVKRKGQSYNFDLGIERITSVSEDGLTEKENQ